MASLDETRLRKVHIDGGAYEPYEEFVSTLKKVVFQCERFISSSSHETLYDDLFSRSIVQQNHIIEPHIKALGVEELEKKKDSFIRSQSGADTAKFDVFHNITRRFYDEVLFRKLGLEYTNAFMKLPESISTSIEKIKAIAKSSGLEENALDGMLSAVLGGLEEPTPEKLVAFLKSHGPFSVLGFYGSSRYLEKPAPWASFPKLGERDVYAWKKGAARSEKLQLAHSVTIVAAKVLASGSGLVFYVDPVDSSDPRDHTSERVFAISFQNFIENNLGAIHNPGAGVKARSE
jgi:hypothetical protein